MLNPGLGIEAGTEYQPHLPDEKTEGETLSQAHTAGAVITSSFSRAYFVQLRLGAEGLGWVEEAVGWHGGRGHKGRYLKGFSLRVGVASVVGSEV